MFRAIGVEELEVWVPMGTEAVTLMQAGREGKETAE